MQNGKTPRAERICGNCDHSRVVEGQLRCWFGPPQPCMVGIEPPKLAGQPPRPMIMGVQPPTWPDYTCHNWEERQSDHPDLHVDPVATHGVSRETQ